MYNNIMYSIFQIKIHKIELGVQNLPINLGVDHRAGCLGSTLFMLILFTCHIMEIQNMCLLTFSNVSEPETTCLVVQTPIKKY